MAAAPALLFLLAPRTSTPGARAQASTVPSQAGLPAPSPAYPSAVAIAPRFVVLIDAAHGGAETGAQLSSQLAEKNLVLALSVHLRSVLSAHGMAVVTTRESDVGLVPDARAAIANRARASACLLLHATTSGTGVHLYTSALAAGPGSRSQTTEALRPWATAQAGFLTQSLKLSSDLAEALDHAAIPVTLGSVSLQPVDTIACPAVILEVAPLLARRSKPAAKLDDPAYQTRLVDALGGAMEQWRADWRSQP